MKYLQRKFSFAAGTPQISDEDWAAAFSHPECPHDWVPPQSADEWEFCRLCQMLRVEYDDAVQGLDSSQRKKFSRE